MTRLRTDHITDIPCNRQAHAERLKAVCDLTLAEVAARSLEASPAQLAACQNMSVAVIPVSSGEGQIPGFDLALKAIADELGFRAAITAPDAAGVVASGTMDMCLWADDDLFVAHRRTSGAVGENGEATGRGFATVLHAMLQGGESESGKSQAGDFVVVRGCGPVGATAARRLGALGHPLIVCDVLAERAERLAKNLRKSAMFAVSAAPDTLRFVLKEHGLKAIPGLLDAAPVPPAPGELLTDTHTRIAAPGVPCLWPSKVPEQHIWHDPLETGTAVMLVAAALGIRCGWSGPAPSPFGNNALIQQGQLAQFPSLRAGLL